MAAKELWEILVPRLTNSKKQIPLKVHKKWDKEVERIAGGLTILKPAKGHWISKQGTLFKEEMIPVRIYCTENRINKIINKTLEHYCQKAVLAYKLSSKVKLVEKN